MMVRYISGKANVNPSVGEIRIPLSEPCKCYVALAEFHLPNTNQKAHDENFVDITCEQIDSNFGNPKRLLKRICFERCTDSQLYNHFVAQNLDFQLIESTDKFLTLKISRTKPPHKIRFARSLQDTIVYFTLAIKHIETGGQEENDRWITIKGSSNP